MNPETEPIPQRKWIAALCGAFATGALVAGVCIWTFVRFGHTAKDRPIEPQLVIEPPTVRPAADTSDEVQESDDWHRDVDASEEAMNASLPLDFPTRVLVSIRPDLTAEGATPESLIPLRAKTEPRDTTRRRKTVSVEQHADAPMRVVVTTGAWYDHSTVVLTLSSVDTKTEEPHIDAAWERWVDFGPHRETLARAVTGHVRLNTKAWQTDRPLILEWDLYGLCGGRDAYLVCDHDKVIIE